MALAGSPATAVAQERSAPSAEDRRLSAILLDRSAVAYRLGRYAEAIVMLEDAYVLSQEPILLYNLGRAYEGAGDRPRAVDAYRRYLETSETSAESAPAQAAIATLEREIEAERRAAEDAAERARIEAIRRSAEDARAAREARAMREERARAAAERAAARRRAEAASIAPWPWAVAGVGGATILVGSIAGALALERHEDAVRAEEQTAAAGRLQEARDLASGANAAFVVGGVLAAAGIAWGIVEVVRESERGDGRAHDEPGVTIEVAPTACGLAVRGAF